MLCAAKVLTRPCLSWVKLGGKGTFSTRPVLPNDRTLPTRLFRDVPRGGHRQPHSITSSAQMSKEVGTVRPSALPVLRLMITSNLVGFSTGRSEGLVPLRILST
jgi:hypothetical protein